MPFGFPTARQPSHGPPASGPDEDALHRPRTKIRRAYASHPLGDPCSS